MSEDRLHPETIAISSGRPVAEPGAGLNSSISLNSTFTAGGPINYGRTGNETWQQFCSTKRNLGKHFRSTKRNNFRRFQTETKFGLTILF